jgi:flagellar biosynthesis protein FliR
MGLISDMETVHGREIARLILLVFILLVLFVGYIALLLFLFIQLGLIDKLFPPIITFSAGWPMVVIVGILLIIPFWLFIWWFLAKYSFGKKVFYK